jgi:hypothetical protein
MWFHVQLLSTDLRKMITSDEIQLGGNFRLKIYGTLSCASGKRMKKENRVFFKSEKEAIALDFRPCGHCLREKYRCWLIAQTNHDQQLTIN